MKSIIHLQFLAFSEQKKVDVLKSYLEKLKMYFEDATTFVMNVVNSEPSFGQILFENFNLKHSRCCFRIPAIAA